MATVTPPPAPTPVDIVEAGPDDAGEVFRMVRELASHENALEAVTSTEERWREMLADPQVTVLVARAAGATLGFVSSTRRLHLWSGADIVALDDLYVRPSARDRGVGEALMHALASRSDGRLIRWEVDEGNIAGQRFYLRLGARLRRKVIAWWQPAASPDPLPRPTI